MHPAWRAATAAVLAASGCTYSYENSAEALRPGEVGGRTLAGTAILDGVAVSARGASLAATSRQTGRFAMLPLPVGRHTLVFRKGKDRVLQRDVVIDWGRDGQPQGVWMGDVDVPASVSLAGACAPPSGTVLADGGLAVDESSGATARIDATGAFAMDGLGLGEHRVSVYATDAAGNALVGGPAVVTFLPTDAGTRKTLVDIPVHKAGTGLATVTFRFQVAGAAPGLTLAGLQVTGLGQSVPFQSNGLAQADLAEGHWTVGIQLPSGVPGVSPPPPVSFVAVAGQVVSLGTLYAVSDAALATAELACHASADCNGGTCQASGVCTGYTPPAAVAASMPFCDTASIGCPAGPIGAANPPAMACVAALSGTTAAVACGACCTPDGVESACAAAGAGACGGAAAPAGTVCSAGGWCRDVGPSLHAIWGSGPSDVWMVGSGGSIVHYDGTTWSGSTSFNAPDDLLAIWGTAATDIWAVGAEGTIQHYTGSSWQLPGGTWARSDLRGVWGSSASDVWAVGAAGSIVHWDGAAWADFANPLSGGTTGLNALWGSGPGDVWAVGDGGAILHFAGAAWSVAASPTTSPLRGIGGSGSGDVTAVGGGGTVVHWNGTAWSVLASGTTGDLGAVWQPSVGTAYAVGPGTVLTRNGSGTWAPRAGPAWPFAAVWGSSGGEVYAAGERGAIEGLVGGATIPSPMPATQNAWFVGGSAASDVWAIGGWSDGGTQIEHWDGSAWTTRSAPGVYLEAIWGTSPSDAWVAGAQLWHSDGSAWSALGWPGTTRNYYFQDLWGTGPSDVWAIGYSFAAGYLGEIWHWDGSAWAQEPSVPMTLVNRIWGSGPTDVWALGSDALGASQLLHHDGLAWTSVPPGASPLSGISGTSATDAWLVGDSGAIQHWDGTFWSSVPSGTSDALRRVWARTPSDAWAVGGNGTVLHWDGTSWAGVASGTTDPLEGVWGSGPHDVWATSRNTVLHFQR